MANKVIANLLKNNAKALGQELTTLGDIIDSKLDVCSTGFYDIDQKLLEVGGFVKGRITELSGSESGGKSTIMYRTAAECQKNPGNLGENGVVVWVDVEQCLNDKAGQDWVKKHGIDIDNLIYSNEIIAEKIMHTIMRYCREGVDLIVVDSVAGMIGANDSVEGVTKIKDVEKKFTGGFTALPKVLANGLKEVSKACREGHTAVVFINQIRDKLGVVFGNPESTPGGRALKFFASVRLRVDKYKEIKEDEERAGVLIKAYVQKSKVSVPFRRSGVDTLGYIPLYFDGRLVSEFDSLVDTAKELEIIKQAGPFFSFGDLRVKGKDAFLLALTEDMKSAIVTAVKANKDKIAVKDEEMEDISDEDFNM